MRVLSIDFDYFQNSDLDIVENVYPDGIDVSTEMSEITWGIRYAFFKEAMDKVSIRGEELDLLKQLFMCQKDSTPVMIAQSHAGIYSFVHEHIPTSKKLMVCNIDMHHDMYNNNPKLDCGNWCNFLKQEYKTFGLQWICNPISKDMYGFKRKDTERALKANRQLLPETLKEIWETKYDVIYLCRSDNWSAPHLDKHFTELCHLLQDTFQNVILKDNVDVPRSEYLQIAEDVKDSFGGLYDKNGPNLFDIQMMESDIAKGYGIDFPGPIQLKEASVKEAIMEL